MKRLPITVGFMLILSALFMLAQGVYGGGTEDINIGIGELQESSGETRAATEDPAGPVPPGEINNKKNDEKAGLLLPAVQKVRSAAGKSESDKPAPGGIKSGEDTEETGLLLPAVQKAREGAARKGTKKGSKGNVETEFKVEKGE